eukprot:TRINITY_DN6565_c0_g1_i2.p1 TRINITY_DN6565_c0_g1~~TRINITY_DN6565_c0_g1_i2.p1  ORF type:complete len:630 (-),score=149.67 TRINITY_DN6565_c0_g1_i2:8-1897(-)
MSGLSNSRKKEHNNTPKKESTKKSESSEHKPRKKHTTSSKTHDKKSSEISTSGGVEIEGSKNPNWQPTHSAPTAKPTGSVGLGGARKKKGEPPPRPSTAPHADDFHLKKAHSRPKSDFSRNQEQKKDQNEKREQYLKQLEAKKQQETNAHANETLVGRLIESYSLEGGKQSNPILGFDILECKTLDSAIQPLINVIPLIQEHASKAEENMKKAFGKDYNPGCAAINLYTQEWDSTTESLYHVLNAIMRDNSMDAKEKSTKLKCFHPFLSLFFSRVKTLPKVTGIVYRGVNLDLRDMYSVGSKHTWWSFTSCTQVVNAMEEFLGNDGPRTLFDIKAVKGVNISQYSLFPDESEIILLPGTKLVVKSVLDLGNNLFLVQLEEIPSSSYLENCLYGDKDAIDFWKSLSKETYFATVLDFCEAIIKNNSLPLVKKLPAQPSMDVLSAYQKFWILWIFSGGDPFSFSEFINYDRPPSSSAEIQLEKFGLLLAFGSFKAFLDGLHCVAVEGYLFPDTFTSVKADRTLKQFYKSYCDIDPSSLPYLLRCTPRKETPFTISYLTPNGLSQHIRIYFSKGEYYGDLGHTKKRNTSLLNLVREIFALVKTTVPYKNADLLSLIDDPTDTRQKYSSYLSD